MQLPKEAITAIRNWEKSKGMPAFLRELQHSGRAKHCEACAGNGQILVSFCSHGPSDVVFPPAGKRPRPSTYFVGDAQFQGGWYLIESTQGFACLACNGSGRNPEYRPGPVHRGDIDIKALTRAKDTVERQAAPVEA